MCTTSVASKSTHANGDKTFQFFYSNFHLCFALFLFAFNTRPSDVHPRLSNGNHQAHWRLCAAVKNNNTKSLWRIFIKILWDFLGAFFCAFFVAPDFDSLYICLNASVAHNLPFRSFPYSAFRLFHLRCVLYLCTVRSPPIFLFIHSMRE